MARRSDLSNYQSNNALLFQHVPYIPHLRTRDRDEDERLEDRAVETRVVVVLDDLVHAVLANERHLGLGRQRAHLGVDAFHGLPDVLYVDIFHEVPAVDALLHVLYHLLLLFVLLQILSGQPWGVDGDGDILGALAVLDVGEDEGVAAGHGGVEAEDAFLGLALAVDDLVLGVHHEEIDQLVGSRARAHEKGAPDVLRGLILDVLVEGLNYN